MNAATLDGFVQLERSVSREKGEFALFALFAREDLPDRRDLVVAAPWVRSQEEGAEYLVQEIQKLLSSAVLTDLSRIVIVKPSDPPVEAINRAIHVQHGRAEVRDSGFFGVPIKHGYVITSQRLAPATR